jgi:hypothetical protein
MPLHQFQFYLMCSLSTICTTLNKEYLIRSLLSFYIMLEVRGFGVLRTEVMRVVTQSKTKDKSFIAFLSLVSVRHGHRIGFLHRSLQRPGKRNTEN